MSKYWWAGLILLAILLGACTVAATPDTTVPEQPAVPSTDTPPPPTATATTLPAVPTTLLSGVFQFEMPAAVEIDWSLPGCSVTGGWADYVYEGAPVVVLNEDGGTIGEGLMGRGETKGGLVCFFPYEVEVPTNAEWYGVCVQGLGPAGLLSREDLETNFGWEVIFATGPDEEPPAELAPCSVVPLVFDDSVSDPDRIKEPPDPVAMREEWGRVGVTGYRITYSIRTLNGQGGLPGDGVYTVVVEGHDIARCTFKPVQESDFDGCAALTAGEEMLLPLDMLYDYLESFDPAFTTVEYDIELPVPIRIDYDDPSVPNDGYKIRVTEFRGTWG